MTTDSNTIKEFLTPNELIELLKISKPTLYRLTDSRTIPFYKIKGAIRFEKKDVLEYLEKNRIESAGEMLWV